MIFEKEITCSNCGYTFSGNFCSACGQKKFHREDFRFKDFSKDIMEEFLDFDSKIFRTLKILLFRPGKLTEDFLNGKQKSHIGPVKLYLIIITVHFLLYNIFSTYSLENPDHLLSYTPEFIRDILYQKNQFSHKPIELFFADLTEKAANTFSLLLYLLIFLTSFLAIALFGKQQKYYMEHLVFSLHFMAFGFLRDILILPVTLLISHQASIIITVITSFLYIFIGIQRVYKLNKKVALVKATLFYILFFCLFGITVFLSYFIEIIKK
jgi:hypothetical protein